MSRTQLSWFLFAIFFAVVALTGCAIMWNQARIAIEQLHKIEQSECRCAPGMRLRTVCVRDEP